MQSADRSQPVCWLGSACVARLPLSEYTHFVRRNTLRRLELGAQADAILLCLRVPHKPQALPDFVTGKR